MLGSGNDFRRLVEQAQSGSRTALDRLFTLCSEWLGRLVHREPRPGPDQRSDPSDFVQDALLEAFKYFSTFKGSSEVELFAWVWRILRTTVVDYYRSQEAQKRSTAREVPLDAHITSGIFSYETCPLQLLVEKEAATALHVALGELPAEDRHLFHLRYVERLSFAELGKMLGTSGEIVRKRLFRLRRLLGERLVGDTPR